MSGALGYLANVARRGAGLAPEISPRRREPMALPAPVVEGGEGVALEEKVVMGGVEGVRDGRDPRDDRDDRQDGRESGERASVRTALGPRKASLPAPMGADLATAEGPLPRPSSPRPSSPGLPMAAGDLREKREKGSPELRSPLPVGGRAVGEGTGVRALGRGPSEGTPATLPPPPQEPAAVRPFARSASRPEEPPAAPLPTAIQTLAPAPPRTAAEAPAGEPAPAAPASPGPASAPPAAAALAPVATLEPRPRVAPDLPRPTPAEVMASEPPPSDEPRIEVHIGRIELRNAPPPTPPAAPAPAAPRGFEEFAAARRYQDRRWT